MSGTVSERTVLPPSRSEELRELREALNARATTRGVPVLIARDGSRVELPDELFGVLHDVVNALVDGLAITVAPMHTVLTTGEAAELLGVSRPTLVRLLESGEIPYEQPGRHRRLRLDDVLAYQDRAKRARAAGLDDMVRTSEDAGLYDAPADVPFERLSEDNQQS